MADHASQPQAVSNRTCADCPAVISDQGTTRCPGCAETHSKAMRLARNRKSYRAKNNVEVLNCKGCGREIFASRNKSGYCSQNEDCRRKQQLAGWRTYDARVRGKIWILPDDGYIDEIAVELTINGVRVVALTDEERMVCLLRMISMSLKPHEMRQRLHVTPKRLNSFLDELGWEVIPDPHVTDKVMMLARKDRPGKILPPEVLDPTPRRPSRKV